MIFPEQYRLSKGLGILSTEPGDAFGVFLIPVKGKFGTVKLQAVVSSGEGWDHVSITCTGIDANRCPKWEEMSIVKDLFWLPTETVVQYHPPHSEYVNQHKYCLHLWRKHDFEYPLPPSIMVGIKHG